MSDTESTTEHETTSADVSAEQQTDEQQQSEDTGSKREARYRRQLRETQAERDQLTERLAGLQRAEVERIAAEQLSQPRAIWAAGAELADLLDDDGNVSADAVNAAAARARDELGVQAPTRLVPDHTQGGMGPATRRADPWTSAFARPEDR